MNCWVFIHVPPYPSGIFPELNVAKRFKNLGNEIRILLLLTCDRCFTRPIWKTHDMIVWDGEKRASSVDSEENILTTSKHKDLPNHCMTSFSTVGETCSLSQSKSCCCRPFCLNQGTAIKQHSHIWALVGYAIRRSNILSNWYCHRFCCCRICTEHLAIQQPISTKGVSTIIWLADEVKKNVRKFERSAESRRGRLV